MNLVRLEFLKLRRTLVWPVVLLLPLIPVMLDAAIFRTPRMQVEATWNLILSNGLTTWWLLIMPLVVSLLAAQVFGLEHQHGGWRLNFSAPRPRMQIIIAKIILLVLLLSLSTLLVAITVMIGAFTLTPILSGQPAWLDYILMVFQGLLGSLGLLSITIFIALRFTSFLAPLALGVIGMVLSFIGINSQEFGPWWPWTFPLLITSSKEGLSLSLPILFNFSINLIFLIFIFIETQRRDT